MAVQQSKLKEISGSHENIFVEPNVQWLAQELSACLAAVAQNGAASNGSSEKPQFGESTRTNGELTTPKTGQPKTKL